MKITRALISVSDKSGLEEFARGLHALGVELLSTGGSAAFLRGLNLPVVEVADYTGYPECFDGRVKTLHPKVHGGFLFQRGNADHVQRAQELEVPPIDLVVVNLYPFEKTIDKEGVTLEEAIENIDIGGPAMLRGAAKNYESVTVITDVADYPAVLEEMKEHDGATTLPTRERLAIKVYQRTAAYDSAIARFLNREQESEGSFCVSLPLCQSLRYGENPHQKANLYGSFNELFEKLQGKELSYTNILDIEAATELVMEFKRPTVAILKHTNPCGVGCDDEDIRAAWDKAFETDKQAPFGGVIVTNRPLNERLARVISEIFTDVIIAPDFESGARAILQKKKNLRLIQANVAAYTQWMEKNPVIRSAPGGLVVMDRDIRALGLQNMEEKVVTQRVPSKEELEAMRFAWRVVKHVKSNAIVFASHDRTLGIGAGQMSRVDSARIAVWKAREAGLSLDGSVVASDALFPFPDGLISAADAGATAAIQPGGSVKDAEVIAAANERSVAMIMTGYRHFLH
ncbi:MAG TPA: bifunctional phosphoribosylaminoimidazolecarboxamide formyltransferase/IMP cyclohydrolase [Verrucomicrobiales bacterium]|nr:bifunctional phosphoribosylaminoimidazolecarboxamide formyltransferase/IMP cyclohydrolase [Verrucomicrobiales bacterium]